MRISIDNLDGQGALNYTPAIAATGPITLQRQLNAPSRCTATVIANLDGLTLPARQARVIVTGFDGTVMFTGYLATEPVGEYIGESTEGPVYGARLSAVSDEWLLDKQSASTGATQPDALSLTSGAMITHLATLAQSGSGRLTVATGNELNPTGVFTAEPNATWSENAATAASASYANYRALDGVITVENAGSTAHVLTDTDGTLSISELALANVRELANDVTLTGELEPTSFVQEHFLGDGTTAAFTLSGAAFRTTNRTLAQDSFTTATLNPLTWTVNDPGSHLSLTSAGLTFNGGNGADGATTLIAPDAVEMGGALVAELSGVTFGAGSQGTLAAFYGGPPVLTSCLAGFGVKQSGGNTVVTPIVNGAEVGTTFTPTAGHTYTLRVRLHCAEFQRIPQRYFCMVDGVVQAFGATSAIDAPMDLVFELRDEGLASNTPVTVLYDTAAAGTPVASSPGACQFAAVNSENLIGSIASVSVTRSGSLWVTSLPPSSAPTTRLIGTAGQGVDCEATYGTATGEAAAITFFAGRIPVAGERIIVSYRSSARSVARLEDAASIATEAASGLPGTARWLGKVLAPKARSSADCETAAVAILAFSTSRACAVAGTYTAVNPAADIWPGDVLNLTSDGVTTALLVRSVEATDGASVPETVRYRVSFANDWATEYADGFGLKLSEAISTDAVLPQTASPGAPTLLANLQQLTVTSLTSTALGVDTGIAPPAGGGFEVRRRDNNFGPGLDPADLVLRSPVRAFTLPRSAQVERFSIRTYDASTPPIYSRWSSTVVVHAPVA